MKSRTPCLLAVISLLGSATSKASAAHPALSAVVQASAADTATFRRFNIPAQPLREAITAFTQQSGVVVNADSTDIVDARSGAVIGRHTISEALRQLLTGTGLQAHFVDSQTVVLRRATTARPTSLDPVRVVARNVSGYSALSTGTATKTATPLRDVPQSISVVTRGLMRDLSMQSMADVVRFIPGVTMGQGEGHRDQPTIRGNGTTSDFFVDGVRDDVQYFRDLYNVERVEALKGSNAMVFGRGGGGGVLNRVTKEARWDTRRELTIQGGSFENRRAAVDIEQVVSSDVAARFNGMYENSGLYRDDVTLRRYGFNPTVTIAPGSQRTTIALGYEYFVDRRIVDRGIPSFNGRPVATDVATFFGDPSASHSDAWVHSAVATVTHRAGNGLNVRNRTSFAAYDKFYQNVFPGAVNAKGDSVSLSAYNNATRRKNFFNQTDLTRDLMTGAIKHTLLLGTEIGRQVTGNLRNTGYFDNTTTSVSAPLNRPTVSRLVVFRPSASDADNSVTNTVGSLYIQDQIELSPHWQLIAGVRFEQFGIRHHNNRNDSTLQRTDRMISPRAGLLFKPVQVMSMYASYSVSHLPSAGDQFSSLTNVTKALEPEQFANYEIGAKWDLTDRFALTTALYRLDHTNTRAPHPTDPSRTLQTGSQRTKGFEVQLSGDVTTAWSIAGGYANQNARITSTTSSAQRGVTVPMVPSSSFSLWNRYQVTRAWGFGLGVVHQAEMFTAIDNKVKLPSFTELDGALYFTLGRKLQLQMYLENLTNVAYYPTAHSNNNITPGSPRAVRISLTTGF